MYHTSTSDFIDHDETFDVPALAGSGTKIDLRDDHYTKFCATNNAGPYVSYFPAQPLFPDDVTIVPTMLGALPNYVGSVVVPTKTGHEPIDCIVGRLANIHRPPLSGIQFERYQHTIVRMMRVKYNSLLPLNNVPNDISDLSIKPAANMKRKLNDFLRIACYSDPLYDVYNSTEAFQKTEPSLKDPSQFASRNITADSSAAVVALSRYIKPLSKYSSQNLSYYAFGKSNMEIANIIHNLSTKHSTVMPTDYSAFDAGQNTFTMYLEHCNAFWFYESETLADYFEQVMQSMNCAVQFGAYSYSTQASRHSGIS